MYLYFILQGKVCDCDVSADDCSVGLGTRECWTLCLQDISPTSHFAYDMDTSPTGQFAYETFRLLDTSPTPWTIRPLNVNVNTRE